jgi:hypothetical protein
MEHKIEVAKKILTIANNYDGQVYGGFVRDVIVPIMNDSNCDLSFKDVDIWFQDAIAVPHFICELVKHFKIESEKDSQWNRELEYNDSNSKFSRRQYRIYSKDEFLFHIDVIISDKLPVNDFYINTVTYRCIENGFEAAHNPINIHLYFTNKIVLMFNNYNPENLAYYNRINRIFFSKGWTVRCDSKHKRLSEFIRKNKLNIKEFQNGSFYDYIPIELKIDVPVLTNNTSELDDNDKNILRLIFANELDVLNGRFYNSIEDNELKIIYKLGLEDYRDKIDNLLK